MVPLKLRIRNFLSYGSQEQIFDFEPHDLICLTGRNGHGKSAMLDAITWSIWGQARKVSGNSKPDSGLLRLGQTHMTVTFDFLCDQFIYRIRRDFELKGKKSVAKLDLGILTQDEVHSLTEKTIKGTQEKINKLIGLDYNSFINSAFLRQGSANEFSKKSARERKEILVNILGISRFEKIRQKALERLRHFVQEKNILERKVILEEEEIKEKPKILEKLKKFYLDLENLREFERKLSKDVDNTKKRKLEIEKKRILYEKTKLVQKQCEDKHKENLDLFDEEFQKWRETRRKSKEFKKYLELSEKNRKKNEKIVKIFREKMPEKDKIFALKKENLENLDKVKELLNKKYSESVRTVAKELANNKSTLNHLEKQQKLIEKSFGEKLNELTGLKKQIEKLDQTLKGFKEAKDKLLENERDFERRKKFYQNFVAKKGFLSKSLENICVKRDLLEREQNICPLCTQGLSKANCGKIKENLGKKRSLLIHQESRLGRVIPKIKEILFNQHALIEGLRKQESDFISKKSTQKELEKKLQEKSQEFSDLKKRDLESKKEIILVKELVKKYAEEQKGLSLKSLFESNREYREILDKKSKYEALCEKFEIEERAYQSSIEELAKINQRGLEYRSLIGDISLQEKRKQKIHELCSCVRKIKLEKKELKNKLENLVEYREQLQKLSAREEELEYEYKKIREKKDSLMVQKGALENQKSSIEKKENLIMCSRHKLCEIGDQIEDYQDISSALGKDGIQALLIEEAVPEIEAEANKILAKLTDNQAHLIIESLRDLKSGATRETLDIKISDTLGIRPYELFSGGEAFRIDFAIRVAISKLLIRRAGSSLQLLIIDEGFGSQDEEGLSHIMEMLYKIRNDFTKVIVVSHLSGMKEYFPVQFNIQKTPQGSSVEVIQQG